MISIKINERYLEVLQPTVDLEQLVDQVLEQYAIETISTKISQLSSKKKIYEAQFGHPFQTFASKVSSDVTFVENVEKENPNWESDFIEWEFCIKGITDWKQKLEHILTI
ncbi:MAG: hypothetical protein AAGG68_16285 [Bacteroidota bacterium]